MTTVVSNRTKAKCMRRASAKLPIVVATRPGATSGIITKLGPHDVLLGRGAPHAYYEGNVKFRTVVATHQADYVSRVMHCHKQAVAQRVLAQVQATGGRFVEAVLLVSPARVGDGDPAATATTTQKAWRIASHAVVLEKVKQALRTKGAVSTASAPVMGISEPNQHGGGGGGRHSLQGSGEQSSTVPAATPVAATAVQGAGAAGSPSSSNWTSPQEEPESARVRETPIPRDLVLTTRDSKKNSPPPQPLVVANHRPTMTVRKAAAAHATATMATTTAGPIARESIDQYALAVWQARHQQEQLAAARARQQTVQQQQLRLHLLLRQRLQGQSRWQVQEQQLLSPHAMAPGWALGLLPSNRPFVLPQLLLPSQRTASGRGSASNY